MELTEREPLRQETAKMRTNFSRKNAERKIDTNTTSAERTRPPNKWEK